MIKEKWLHPSTRTNTASEVEANRIGGGTIFTENIKSGFGSMVDRYAITGWHLDGTICHWL